MKATKFIPFVECDYIEGCKRKAVWSVIGLLTGAAGFMYLFSKASEPLKFDPAYVNPQTSSMRLNQNDINKDGLGEPILEWRGNDGRWYQVDLTYSNLERIAKKHERIK
ncbi:hypothetical protein JW756_03385 [Candidatus Woesearchaeota archaeon]|nr:hypothetical protein [Candidatus Woesearchaeota archaeon]